MEKNSTSQILLNGFSDEIIALGTGSPEFQIAKFTYKIQHLTTHLSSAKKDFSCKYGMLKLVNKRSKMLKYLETKDHERYKTVVKNLGLRK